MKYSIILVLAILLHSCIKIEDTETPQHNYFIGNNSNNLSVGDTIYFQVQFENSLLPNNNKIALFSNAGRFISDSDPSNRIETYIGSDNRARAQLILENSGEQLFGYEFDFVNSKEIVEFYKKIMKRDNPAFIESTFFSVIGNGNLNRGDTTFLELHFTGQLNKINGTQVIFTTNAGHFSENIIDSTIVTESLVSRFINGKSRAQVILKNKPGKYFFRYQYEVDTLLLEEIYIDI